MKRWRKALGPLLVSLVVVVACSPKTSCVTTPQTTQPTLKIFLDVNGFDPASPASTDDAATFIPLRDGNTSYPMKGLPDIGQIRVAGAYVDGSGATVPPPSDGPATLTLSNVSALKGVASNYSVPWIPEDSDDFQAVDTVLNFRPDHTVRFRVNVLDYGGWATATIAHGSQTSPARRMPKDNEGNPITGVGPKAGN